jgi:hypothetical protein
MLTGWNDEVLRRQMEVTTLPIMLLVAISVLAACGGDDTDVVAGTAPPPTSRPEPTPWTSLTITVDLGDGSAPQGWTLTCDPPGGTHPQPGSRLRRPGQR